MLPHTRRQPPQQAEGGVAESQRQGRV
jgi:hypothetical protein